MDQRVHLGDQRVYLGDHCNMHTVVFTSTNSLEERFSLWLDDLWQAEKRKRPIPKEFCVVYQNAATGEDVYDLLPYLKASFITMGEKYNAYEYHLEYSIDNQVYMVIPRVGRPKWDAPLYINGNFIERVQMYSFGLTDG